MSILRKCLVAQISCYASVEKPIFTSENSRDGSTDDEIAAEYQMMANGVDNEFLGFEVSFFKFEIFHF